MFLKCFYRSLNPNLLLEQKFLTFGGILEKKGESQNFSMLFINFEIPKLLQESFNEKISFEIFFTFKNLFSIKSFCFKTFRSPALILNQSKIPIFSFKTFSLTLTIYAEIPAFLERNNQ